MTTFVWDATLLIHAQEAERADVLGTLVPVGRHVTTSAVAQEVTAGIPDWLEVVDVPLDAPFAGILTTWRLRCGAQGGRNEGEASVLAYVDARRDDDIAVIDDSGARRVGLKHLGPDRVHGSLWLLARGVTEDPRRLTSVSRLCDAVLDTGIYWGFGRGGFVTWARANHLVE